MLSPKKFISWVTTFSTLNCHLSHFPSIYDCTSFFCSFTFFLFTTSIYSFYFSGSIRNKPLGGTLLGTEQNASTSSNPKEQNQNATTGNTSNSMKTKSSGIKGAGSSKMIKRVYLFSSDPNSIEVLASEGDQALVR